MKTTIDLSNPQDVRAWLDAVRTRVEDLGAVAREGALRPRKRVLSRGEMRRRARWASKQITALLDTAAASVAGPEGPSMDEGAGGSDPT